MLDETGMMGIHQKEEPQVKPAPEPAPKREVPKIFSPDKMTPAEMVGAGAVMLGNIAFVSWWAMNDDTSEVIEMMDAPSEIVPSTHPTELPLIVPSLPVAETSEAQTNTPILEVAEVNQEGTFKDAFDAARAQVGPGGIFEWHGQWYNTYTAEEWTGMEPVSKNDYALLVKPFLENDNAVPHATLDHDALSGQGNHEVIAHAEETNQHPSDAHHAEQAANLIHPPAETHLDTLDDLFPNT